MSEQKYYKAFNKNLQCRGFQYEIGKEYVFDGEPISCKQGFHYCKSIADCYKFYSMNKYTRICEVEPLGDVSTDDGVKYCTNKIKIVAEIENPRLRSNLSETSTGYCNTGSNNSGNCNTGNNNSGYYNSGNCNTGSCNSGSNNSGNCNTGNKNSGDYNSGDYNSGNYNSGVFNTSKKPNIKMFDKDSDWTYDDWHNSIAYEVMNCCPYSYSYFINKSDMTEEEKEQHPEYKTLRGYTKVFTVTTEDKQKWWNDLSESDKQAVYDLPNFDADKFRECTGIEVEE